MADIVVVRSPLKGERELLDLPVGQKFDEWLTAYVARTPGKLGTPKLYKSGEPVPEPWDFELEERGHFLLVFEPMLPVAIASIVYASLVSMAISAIVSLIFRPKKPSPRTRFRPGRPYKPGGTDQYRAHRRADSRHLRQGGAGAAAGVAALHLLRSQRHVRLRDPVHWPRLA